MKKTPEWKQFEDAVARFAAALDPEVTVLRDVRKPDRHTGKRRQRDVWIESRVAKLFPVTVLVSCKRVRRRLSEKEVDAFHGELLSSGAQKGVLYSYSGFTKPAIAKARVLGICCCRLFQRQAADLPEALSFRAYCVSPVLSLTAVAGAKEWAIRTYGDLFKLEVLKDGKLCTFLDALAEIYRVLSTNATKRTSARQAFPTDWTKTVGLTDPEEHRPELKLGIALRWKVYEATLSAQLLDGSYSYTTGEFVGDQIVQSPVFVNGDPGTFTRDSSDNTSHVVGSSVVVRTSQPDPVMPT